MQANPEIFVPCCKGQGAKPPNRSSTGGGLAIASDGAFGAGHNRGVVSVLKNIFTGEDTMAKLLAKKSEIADRLENFVESAAAALFAMSRNETTPCESDFDGLVERLQELPLPADTYELAIEAVQLAKCNQSMFRESSRMALKAAVGEVCDFVRTLV